MNVNIKNYFHDISEEHKIQIRQLYNNPFSTFEYFETFFDGKQFNLITIHDEGKLVHLIVFYINEHDKEAYILNRLFYLDTKYLHLLANLIFSDFQNVKKISLKHLLNPFNRNENINLVCNPYDENYIIPLPISVSDYLLKLSPNMRQQSKRRVNNLKKAFLNYDFRVYEKEEIPDKVIKQIIKMNHSRMSNKNIISGINEDYEKNILNFVSNYGFVTVLEINNLIVAGLITYKIGNHYFMQTISSDPDFDKYSVGHTCLFLTIQRCIELEGKQFHLLWGNNFYKKRFLAQRVQLYSTTLFRTPIIQIKHYLINIILPKLTSKSFIKVWLKSALKHLI